MAPRGDAQLFLGLLFITLYCTANLAMGIPMDCCLEVSRKEIPRAAFADYRRQIGGQGCNTDAVILVTRRGRELCMPADQDWVLKAIQHVKHLQKLCKKTNYKGNRCFGVRPQETRRLQ